MYITLFFHTCDCLQFFFKLTSEFVLALIAFILSSFLYMMPINPDRNLVPEKQRALPNHGL